MIEFGSGASRKTRILLDVIDQITSYVPIDINPVELARAAAVIGGDYPWLELFPIAGDFTKALDLGPALMFAERFGFFPGSTLGNFTPEGAINFLRTARQMLGSDGRLPGQYDGEPARVAAAVRNHSSQPRRGRWRRAHPMKAVSMTMVAGQPVLWMLLGYQFEAASMIAGLSACLMVRIWVSLNARSITPWTWAVDLTVTAIALLFTAGWIVLQRPVPFYALLSGTGFGALGAGIIAVALAWVKRIQPLAGIGDAPTAADGSSGDREQAR